MIRMIATLVGAMLSFMASVGWAQTGNEEVICRADPNVIYCDNFEDRVAGSPGFVWPATYKNNGYNASAAGSLVNPQVVTTPTFSGNRALQMTTPANSTGGGYLETTWPAGSQTTVYIRVYSMRSSNYILSPIAVKGFHTLPNASNGLFSYLGGSWNPILFSYKASPDTLTQNVNLPAVTVTPGQWYCFEVRLTRSTGGTNGTVEGWIDGIQKWSYPNIAFDTNDTYSGLLIVSYWNCSNGDCSGAFQHPEMYHYYDNIIASTNRIGCLQQQGVVPTAPSGLTVR